MISNENIEMLNDMNDEIHNAFDNDVLIDRVFINDVNDLNCGIKFFYERNDNAKVYKYNYYVSIQYISACGVFIFDISYVDYDKMKPIVVQFEYDNIFDDDTNVYDFIKLIISKHVF